MSGRSLPRGIRRLLRLRGWRGIRGEVRDELWFHVESRVGDLVAHGLSPGTAREQALREFGDLAQSERELVDVDRRRFGRARRGEWAMSLIQDLKYGARGLARRPALTAVAVLALTIGIGANAVMFGVVDQLLLRPPAGVAAPEGVHRIYFRARESDEVVTSPVTTYLVVSALRRDVPGFTEVAGFNFVRAFTLGHGRDAQSVDVQMVSGNYFHLLGVQPQRGRTFTPAEDVPPQGARVAVVSDAFWRGELGERSDVVGLRLEVNREIFTVVGVAPPEFGDLDRHNVDLWVPIASVAAEVIGDDWYNAPNSFWIRAIARTRTGVDPALTAEEATTVFRHEQASWRQSWRDSTASVVLGPLVGVRQPGGMSAEARVSFWLMGVSAIVLLIACANVANLLIARTLDRRREIAVRLALGVSRGRLLRQLLTESVLLAAVSAVAAVIVARWGAQAVEHLLLPGIVWSDQLVDGRMLAFTLAAATACIVLCGFAPAVQGVRENVADGLKSSSRQVAGTRGGLRSTLLLVQAALSVVLLIGAGLFVKSLRQVVGRDVGITLDRVLMVTMNLGRAGFSNSQIRQTFEAGVDRITAIAGVEHAAAIASTIPLRSAMANRFHVPGADKRPELAGGGPYEAVAPSEFFAATGARIIAGRSFTAAEERTPSRVAIVNDLVAKAYWPGKNPVGQCVEMEKGGVCTTVVGVVQTVMLFSIVRDDRAVVYVPPSHPAFADDLPGAIIVRTAGDPAMVAPLVRAELQRLSPAMPYVSVTPFIDLLAPQLRPWRLGATMFTLFGAIALAIAAIGLYSVLAYWVSQRQHEIGVRIALGAQREDVVRLVARQASRPIVAGLVLGSAAAAVASRWVESMLYETSAHDPTVYTIAAGLLALAALAACVVPARRSAGIDPAIALRAD